MISVIIPTYNEKKNISKILKKLLSIKIISEIIFVDDSSTDGTFNEIKKFLKNKKVKAYKRNKIKRDLSRSVLLGVKKSKNELILVMDCDLQHNSDYIIKMKKKLVQNNFDIVIASRFSEKKIEGNLGFFRSLLSNFAIKFISYVLGRKSLDPLSGFFLCKKDIISKYEKFFFKRGYKILFDIIYNGKNNLKIGHQQIIFKKRKYEKSKFNLKIIFIFLLQILYTFTVVKKVK